MSTATARAVIVVRRPEAYFFGGARSFLVWIDGRHVGKVKPRSAAEFAVESGEHTVAVSMDWLRSKPFQVSAAAGSRTELMIGVRSGVVLKMFLPIVVAAVAAALIMTGLREAGGVNDIHWWVRWLLFIAIYVAVFAAYALLAPVLVRGFWALWTLEPVAPSASQGRAEAEPSAAADRGGR